MAVHTSVAIERVHRTPDRLVEGFRGSLEVRESTRKRLIRQDLPQISRSREVRMVVQG